MIETAKARGCTVIVSSSDATDHLDEYLSRGADYVIVGEGEVTLGELMDTLTGRLAAYDRRTCTALPFATRPAR